MSFKQFEQLGIDEDFFPYLEKNNIKAPNDVQKKIIPSLLLGQHTLCLAQTGEGKTLAYLLPLIEKIKRIEDTQGVNHKKSSPMLIVVTPTQELGLQVFQILKDLGHYTRFRVRSLLKGQSMKVTEVYDQSYEVLVATPHRLKKALLEKRISLKFLQDIVFDECDQLLAQEFEKEIKSIFELSHRFNPVLSFFAATMSVEGLSFLDKEVQDLKRFEIGDVGARQARVQTFELYLKSTQKEATITQFLKDRPKGQGIVFVSRKKELETLSPVFKKVGVSFGVLSSELDRSERLKVIRAFQEKKFVVLLASDLAARGMDFKNLQWVLNYSLPQDPLYYLHRAGRVGRAGAQGVVYNLISERDQKYIEAINKTIKEQKLLKMRPVKAPPKGKTSSGVKKKEEQIAKTKKKQVTKKTPQKRIRGYRR